MYHYEMNPYPCMNPDMMEDTMTNMVMYPEIYFKIQPFIIRACDAMDMCGCVLPTKKMVMCLCNQICGMLLTQYPELAVYDTQYPVGAMGSPSVGISQFDEAGRGSLLRDFIWFFIFSEFFRRRRGF